MEIRIYDRFIAIRGCTDNGSKETLLNASIDKHFPSRISEDEGKFSNPCTITTYQETKDFALKDKAFRTFLDFALKVCDKKVDALAITLDDEDTIATAVVLIYGFKLVEKYTANFQNFSIFVKTL